jgi:hypothetical protein
VTHPIHDRYPHAQDRAEQLAERLDDGWDMINAARDPNRRRHLEDHFLVLLEEYERLCDESEQGYIAQPLETYV